MTNDSDSTQWRADATEYADTTQPQAHRKGCGGMVIAVVLASALGSAFGVAVSYLLRKLGV